MLDAVLFDLDGTLTDPEVGITSSLRHALASVGHPAPDDLDLRWMIGPPMRSNFTRYGLPEHLHEDATVAYRARHVAVGLAEAELIPGMVDVLAGLAADGVPLALATAKPVEQGRRTLELFDLEQWFAVVTGSAADGVARSKAHIVAEALRELGDPDPARVAMVGDRLHDVEGGRANGCLTIGVGWGFAEAGELDLVAPDHVVQDPVDLLSLLRALP
ncbi:HAD-IA family hydrolase [Aquihabitans sp. G128]|uniref:HAD-IA family hydrolase n=1 Tax=Aquihabitans sp. G128 TaxID=2849779 RepID=UPI001C239ADC|nr:HAD-IA family hydrolase [Aquihabitans sp. G128]QXC61469.1 HAD-IA family hydrolase [Aquihabitans sp. G128]